VGVHGVERASWEHGPCFPWGRRWSGWTRGSQSAAQTCAPAHANAHTNKHTLPTDQPQTQPKPPTLNPLLCMTPCCEYARGGVHARAAAARTRWCACGAVCQVPVARQPGEGVPSLLVSTRGALEARLTFERARVLQQRRRLRQHRCRAHERTCKRTAPRIPHARQSPSHARTHTRTRTRTRIQAHAHPRTRRSGARTGGGEEPDDVQLPRDRHRGLRADGAAGCAIIAAAAQ
jgi:hypothetical protein